MSDEKKEQKEGEPLTQEEIDDLRALRDAFRRSMWVGKFGFKLLLALGAGAAAYAQLKAQIFTLR